MTQDEALKLALETLEADHLEMVADANGHMVFLKDKAITAIKEALAKEKALQALHDENERLGLYKDAYAEQEPLAWISTGPASMIHWTADKPVYGDDWVPLYTTPPQRTWVGLTAKEKHEFRYSHMTTADFIDAIEAKLKDKNTRGQE